MKKALLIIIIMTISITSFCQPSNKDKSSVKEGFINVTGGKIWYKIVGAGKSGTPLLTIHGGPGAPHDYLEPMEELANERPLIFYDQLGCGNSDRPDDTTLWKIERFCEEIDIIRKELNLSEVHLMGQSWGAMLAVEYMLRNNPEGVKSLVLSGPYLSTALWSADQQYWISQMPDNYRDSIKKFEEQKNYTAPGYLEAVDAFYKEHLCRINPWPKPLMDAFEKMGTSVYLYMFGPSEFTITGTLMNKDLTEELSKINVPVLFTCGEFDEARPETVRYFQSKVSDCDLHVFKGASHSHILESTKEYISVVSKFLKNK